MNCMKTAICDECTKTLESYGELCLAACQLACFGMTEGEIATFNPTRDVFANSAIEFLEKKLYLISSEISKNEIGYMPTCEPTLIDDNTLAYCWCDSSL